jgi:hypothetical protein
MDRLRRCRKRPFLGVTTAAFVFALVSPVARAQTISFRLAPGSPAPAGASPASVAVGDFNDDGKPDYAIANAGDNTVSVLLGNGDGTFTPAPHSPFKVNRNPFPTPCVFTKCGSVPLAVAVADFNRDGRQDLAVTNIPINDLCSVASIFGGMCSSVAVLLGNGDGSFQDSNQFDPGGQLSISLAIGDFNGDGKPDLATANVNSSTISILLGDGTGRNFTQASRSPLRMGRRPAYVATGFFNGDTIQDLAVANADDATLAVLLGNGNGTFTAAPGSPIAVGTRPLSIAVADFDRDGQFDMAVADFSDSAVSVLLGNGDGTFRSHGFTRVGAQPSAVAVADFNSDGKPDLVVANRLSSSASLLKGNGDGSFVLTRNLPVGADPQSITTADFNGDGEPDLLAASAATNTASIFLNSTDVIPPTTVAMTSPAPNSSGWNKSSVVVSLSAADNPGGSGVKEIRYAIGNDAEVVRPGTAALINLTSESVFIISYYAVDEAGNAETARSLRVQIDPTSPTITASQTPAANGAGWSNRNVMVSFSCADDFSGVATCTAPITLGTEGVGQTVSGTATDLAGNQATTTRTVSLDKTPPSLTMPTLAASYALNAAVTLSFAASDSMSGLSSVTATLNGVPVSSGTTLSLGHPGTNTFTLAATDVAGNTAAQTATFTVLYNFSGFLPPISNDGGTVFKLGSTVPVKFRLTGGSGASVSTAVAHLALQLTSNGVPSGTPIDATASGGADAGNLFRYDGTQYIFNLSTTALTVGTWQLQAILDDGTTHTVLIGAK